VNLRLLSPLLLLALASCTPGPTVAPSTPTPAAPPGPTPGAPGLAVFYGAVVMDAAAAPDGTVVVAEVNGASCGSGMARAGRYEMAVASEAERRGCGKAGDTVVFRLLGTDPGPAFEPQAKWQLASQPVNLSLKTR